MNITSHVSFSQKFSMNEISQQILTVENSLKISQVNFNNNPNKKTATKLSDVRESLVFLNIAIKYTAEFKAAKKIADQAQHEKFVTVITKLTK